MVAANWSLRLLVLLLHVLHTDTPVRIRTGRHDGPNSVLHRTLLGRAGCPTLDTSLDAGYGSWKARRLVHTLQWSASYFRLSAKRRAVKVGRILS
jgi:hypothetical protein